MPDPEDVLIMFDRTKQLTSFAEERGATMVEYGFMLGLIAVVVAVAVTFFGPAVAALLSDGLDALL